MARIRFPLALLTLLGALVAVSGSANAAVDPGSIPCDPFGDATWHDNDDSIPSPGHAWNEAENKYQAAGDFIGQEAQWVIDILHDVVPPQGLESPVESWNLPIGRICVNFLTICGPILDMIERL